MSMIPLNMLGSETLPNRNADIVLTGCYSEKAVKVAHQFCDKVNIVNEISDTLSWKNYTSMEDPSSFKWSKNPSYVHMVDSETAHGFEIKQHVTHPDGSPLFMDMSSSMFTKPLNYEGLGGVYSSLNKVVGLKGVACTIIDTSLLHPMEYCPEMMNLKLIQDMPNYTAFNTQCLLMANLMLHWIQQKGGITHFQQENRLKTNKIYEIIDKYPDFYLNKIVPKFRSERNVCFFIKGGD